ETEFTKPVDFHSFRRAFKQALADAGVELQTAMALSGASDAKAHQRYLANTAKMRRLPEAALPTFSIVRAETLGDDSESGLFSEREKGFEPSTSTLARLHSTTELLPRGSRGFNRGYPACQERMGVCSALVLRSRQSS